MDYTISTCGIICHIDEYCRDSAMKYNDLADAVGIDVKTLYKIRKGQQLPSILLASLIAEKMEVDVRKLFEIKALQKQGE